MRPSEQKVLSTRKSGTAPLLGLGQGTGTEAPSKEGTLGRRLGGTESWGHLWSRVLNVALGVSGLQNFTAKMASLADMEYHGARHFYNRRDTSLMC